jgi:hypothetical protein
MIQDQIELNFRGLHFKVDITNDTFKVKDIRIVNQQELSDYIESDLDFDEIMLKMVHKLEEKEEQRNVRSREFESVE